MAHWSLMHELAVAAYLLAAALCLRAAFRSEAAMGRRSGFWLGTAILLAALALSKQFDLELLITEVGRDYFRSRGEYAQRREFQIPLVGAIATICMVIIQAYLWRFRKHLPRHWPAIIGLIFLIGFIVIRTISLHHVDAILAAKVGGLRWNGILELTGLVLIMAGALRTRGALDTEFAARPKLLTAKSPPAGH